GLLRRITQRMVLRATWKAQGACWDEQSCLTDSSPHEPINEAAVITQLAPEDSDLVALRHQGFSWAEIGRRTGTTAIGCRRQLGRAISQATSILGLVDIDPDEPIHGDRRRQLTSVAMQVDGSLN